MTFDKVAYQYHNFKLGLNARAKGKGRDEWLRCWLHLLGGLGSAMNTLLPFKSIRVVLSKSDPIRDKKVELIREYNFNKFEFKDAEPEFINESKNEVYVTLMDHENGFSQYFDGRFICSYYPKKWRSWQYIKKVNIKTK